MPQWIEPFSKAYIGFTSEKTPFTDLPMSDLDSPAAKTNYYLTDRTRQYLDIVDVVSVKNSAVLVDPTTYTVQRLGAIVRMSAALSGTPVVTMSGSFVPMYRLLGGRNIGNTSARAEIDTTGGDDTDMVGAPGRPKRGGAFTFIPGSTIVNKAGKTVGLKSMLEAAAKAGAEVIIAIQNDVRNVLLPRDTMYSFIGNTDMQRNLNAAIEMPVTFYQAKCSDANSYEFIDYVA